MEEEEVKGWKGVIIIVVIVFDYWVVDGWVGVVNGVGGNAVW